MWLGYTAEDIAFRDEVRSFILGAVPERLRPRLLARQRVDRADIVEWHRILASVGWGAPHWPEEFGGTGWHPVQQFIFSQEMQMAPVPPRNLFGLNLVGPVIFTYGSAAQKAHFLPRILQLDDWWCQGFSEPNAGSDLASLKIFARRDGDSYVVNGQKIWTTYAQNADWIFCLVRTDRDARPQHGISFLLIDMKSPGVNVKPIATMDGFHHLNEVFFDEVVVPAENLVGEENRGWSYAKHLLTHERTTLARGRGCKRTCPPGPGIPAQWISDVGQRRREAEA
jgi:alkylation response protein AidB-like acyl-CoA dehydrogenase